VQSGGETGAANQTMEKGAQQMLRIVVPAVMTIISCFQPAAIQLYLLCAGALSAITATMLRNPGFRQSLKMSPLPTKESQELWTKVANGKIPLASVMRRDGTMIPVEEIEAKYLPPSQPAKTVLRKDINLKAKAAIPAHLRPSQAPKVPEALRDRDDDYDSPPDGILNKLDWFGRNYKPRYVYNRMKNFLIQASGRSRRRSLRARRMLPGGRRKTMSSGGGKGLIGTKQALEQKEEGCGLCTIAAHG
jgi:YidC/Oxa1 family membrane protein insertase